MHPSEDTTGRIVNAPYGCDALWLNNQPRIEPDAEDCKGIASCDGYIYGGSRLGQGSEPDTMDVAGQGMIPQDDDLTLGERAKLTEVFLEHRPRLLAMVRRRLDAQLLGRLDPEDILSQAYLVADQRWKQFPAELMTPYAWLYRIVLFCIIDAWRKETRVSRDVRVTLPWPEQSSMELALNLVDTATSPSAAGDRRELEHKVARVLESLRDDDRQVLWMKHFDGLTYKEIAAVLRITENAATVRHWRALERLRQVWNVAPKT